jgi:hypothetical protein
MSCKALLAAALVGGTFGVQGCINEPATAPPPPPPYIPPPPPPNTLQVSTPPPMQFAPSCRTDAQCAFARCNTQIGRCVFPCGSSGDCQPGAQCMMAGTPAAACAPAALPGLPAPPFGGH